ncbi:helix-turn-helix domain-containing protein [Hoeflea poritis]|uniref:Helix-turn-helix domain-containing protein n=1 Tax=Hoeflea poritis TaxID=2993659 RepID=A0ABT4VMG7_9HYPH|nr:helix-turn-helix domain-containing protein [Hoeflea poritis]MDA4845893.1 helix-turn-helix domain-containing protein [Hoeflea poritis]
MSANRLVTDLEEHQSDVGKKHCSSSLWKALHAVYNAHTSEDETVRSSILKVRTLDNLIFLDLRLSGQSLRHESKHAKDADFLILQIFKSGRATGVLGDQSWEINSGEIHILDFSRELYSTATHAEMVSVIIPHDAIGYNPDKHPPHIHLSGKPSIAQFILSTVLSLVMQLSDVSAKDERSFSQGFCNLIRCALLTESATLSVNQNYRKERRQRMQTYISQHLSDPELDAEHLCKTFHVSRPTIYRDFAEAGGVAKFITQRRLERAYYRLTSSGSSPIRVSNVAFELGFMDPGYFSRIFRRRFGISPKEAASSNSDFRQNSVTFEELCEHKEHLRRSGTS